MSNVSQHRTGESVAEFIKSANEVSRPTAAGGGRLVFAMDATLSRQPTWDMAQGLQQRMFEVAAGFNGLAVQLVYFRGFSECRASRFVEQGEGLARLMGKIVCEGGHTQIEKVLKHVHEAGEEAPVGALVYVGDAMEENADRLCVLAGELARRGVKAFLFQEGKDPVAAGAFREIARITGGAYAAFDAGAPERLGSLLGAAAAYASGGRAALADRAGKGDGAARLLLEQMGGAA